MLLFKDPRHARAAFSDTGEYARVLDADPVEGFAFLRGIAGAVTAPASAIIERSRLMSRRTCRKCCKLRERSWQEGDDPLTDVSRSAFPRCRKRFPGSRCRRPTWRASAPGRRSIPCTSTTGTSTMIAYRVAGGCVLVRKLNETGFAPQPNNAANWLQCSTTSDTAMRMFSRWLWMWCAPGGKCDVVARGTRRPTMRSGCEQQPPTA
jgi:hypothetical protein